MTDFVTVPFDVLPDTTADAAVDYLRSNLAGWEPASGSVETWLIAAVARMVAELVQVASTVPPAVFRQYGIQVVQLPPLEGVRATVPSLWTAADSLGHTIPAGTQVGYRVTGDMLTVFEVDSDYTIPPGFASLSPVTLVATDVGTAWNGVPAGALELVDSLSWVSTIAANTVSAGGIDPEADDAYLNRLAAELRLLTPRPILPDDFAVLARRVTGVARALAIDGLDPGTNEIQRVAITGSPTGGSTALTYSGQTATVPWNTNAAGLQTLLVALSNIGPGDVTCTGGPLPGTPIDVEFTGALGGTNVSAMTKSDSYTGGSSPTTVITTPTGGVAGSTGNERMVTVFPVDTTGTGCPATVRTTTGTYLDGLREVSFAVHVGTPTYTTVNVTYAVKVSTGYDSTTVVAAVDAALGAYLSPSVWAGGDQSPPVWRTGENKVRYLAVSAVISGVPGVAYVSTLTVNSGTSDVTLAGSAPLPIVGTISGSSI